MLHFAQVVALLVASVDPTGAEKPSVKESTAKVVAKSDASTATEQADPAAPSGVKVVHEDGATTLTLEIGRAHV